MIIGKLVSLFAQRLVATLAVLWVGVIATLGVLAAALPDSTWVALKPLPHQGHSAVFALAVDPSNNQAVIAGNSEGTLLRSADGAVTWNPVHTGKAALTTIAFSPYKFNLVLAGTRGSGALASNDGGMRWTAATGLENRIVRAFAFSLTVIAAGTDHGVYLSQDGFSWLQSGLADRSVDALGVAAIHTPVRFVAGSDTTVSGGSAPLFQSTDGGATWSSQTPAISGTAIIRLVAGPLPPTSAFRPLIAGTNAGLFESTDNEASFIPLSGGNLLPSTDYTQVAFVTDHFDHFYVGSDGGGSGSGGLWRTNDSGVSFTTLAPPMPSVTALAVSNDELPVLYVATFRPSDHVAALWAIHDTGGAPQGPVVSPSPVVSGTRTATPSGSAPGLFVLLQSSQAPYVAIGIAALLVIGLAVVAHFRGRRR